MIDPNSVSTLRVGQLPPNSFNLSDKIPHEIGTDLSQGTVQQLAETIGGYLDTTLGTAFRPITVLNGQTLPDTTVKEWILVGKGTFNNVNGGAIIVTTEELNALMSNGSYWFIGVEIPIDANLLGIVQTIRSGFTETTPSENTIYNALLLKADKNNTGLLNQLEFSANGTDNFVNIGTAERVKSFFYNSVLQQKATFSQTGNIVTFTFIPEAGTLNLQFI
jgi:hypothetical protein